VLGLVGCRHHEVSRLWCCGLFRPRLKTPWTSPIAQNILCRTLPDSASPCQASQARPAVVGGCRPRDLTILDSVCISR